jgi:hypothetical protein
MPLTSRCTSVMKLRDAKPTLLLSESLLQPIKGAA